MTDPTRTSAEVSSNMNQPETEALRAAAREAFEKQAHESLVGRPYALARVWYEAGYIDGVASSGQTSREPTTESRPSAPSFTDKDVSRTAEAIKRASKVRPMANGQDLGEYVDSVYRAYAEAALWAFTRTEGQ